MCRAVLAGATALVALSLCAGLAASTWQWRRAEAAARTSARVTDYLTEQLAAASPDAHGGQWPTMLQLLETSRKDLDQKFADDPDTRMQLLQVISRTYRELNRYGIAIPLAEQWVAMSIERHGPDDLLSLVAQLDLAHALQIQGSFDQAVALMEPVRDRVAREFGGMSDEYQRLLYVMHGCYSRLGRYDDAEGVLAEAGRITEAKSPPGSADRLSHLNHVQVLRVGQPRQALAQREANLAQVQAAAVHHPATLLAEGCDEAVPVRAALRELARVQGRPRQAEKALRGSQGGAFI